MVFDRLRRDAPPERRPRAPNDAVVEASPIAQNTGAGGTKGGGRSRALRAGGVGEVADEFTEADVEMEVVGGGVHSRAVHCRQAATAVLQEGRLTEGDPDLVRLRAENQALHKRLEEATARSGCLRLTLTLTFQYSPY